MKEFIKEFWTFVKTQKKWWLLPTFIILVILGLVIVFAGSTISSFIYTLF